MSNIGGFSAISSKCHWRLKLTKHHWRLAQILTVADNKVEKFALIWFLIIICFLLLPRLLIEKHKWAIEHLCLPATYFSLSTPNQISFTVPSMASLISFKMSIDVFFEQTFFWINPLNRGSDGSWNDTKWSFLFHVKPSCTALITVVSLITSHLSFSANSFHEWEINQKILTHWFGLCSLLATDKQAIPTGWVGSRINIPWT